MLRCLLIVHTLLLIALAAYSIIGYSQLPDRYAAHFDPAGEVDRWVDRESWEFWLLPTVALLLGIGMIFLLRIPQHYNYPQRATVGAWPPDRRRPVHNLLRELILWIAVGLDLIFLATLFAIFHSATGKPPDVVIWIVVGSFLIWVPIIAYLIRVQRLVDRIETELRSTGRVGV